MNAKKIAAWTVGIVFALILTLGLIYLVLPNVLCDIIGWVVICLSLAWGLLMPNPVSLWTLAAGVCMVICPGWAAGILLILAGTVGAVVNLFTGR